MTELDKAADIVQKVAVTVRSWPFHLLDGVKSASVRNWVDSLRYSINTLISEGELASHSVSMTIDDGRELLAWLNLYQSAHVQLEGMAETKKNVEAIINFLETKYDEIASSEKHDIHDLAEPDIFDESDGPDG